MILYFSGTGNSLAIARAIAEHVDDKVMALREAVQADLSQEKRIGLIYPSYWFNAPRAVTEILQRHTLPMLTPAVNADLCVGCGICAEVCPPQGLKWPSAAFLFYLHSKIMRIFAIQFLTQTL